MAVGGKISKNNHLMFLSFLVRDLKAMWAVTVV
jgi:hypothetical protein